MGKHATWQEKLQRRAERDDRAAAEQKQRMAYAQSVRGMLVRRWLAGLVKRVADVHCVDEQDMLGPTQKRTVVHARHVLWAAIRAHRSAWTLADIGKLFLVDRSAVGNAIRKVCRADVDAVLGCTSEGVE